MSFICCLPLLYLLRSKNMAENLLQKVCFPEVERAEWINQIVKQMWPYFSAMFNDVFKNKVEPEMKKALPSSIQSLKFTQADLGNQPLRVGGVRVYTEHVKPSEIIADVDIIYAGDANLELSFDNGISAGITSIQLRGTLRLEINPLLSKSPVIGGISLYFIQVPELDYDMTNLLNVLDIPGISHLVKKVLLDVIDSFMVLPNRVKIPLGDPADLDALRFPEPIGVLNVDIIEAKDLVAHDKNFFSKNSSDPYVIVKVGSFTFTSNVVKDTLNPKWKKQSCKLFVSSTVGKRIFFEMFDSDKLADDILGRVDMNLLEVVHSSATDFWLELKDTTSGSLHVSCGWFEFSSNPKDIQRDSAGRIISQTCLFVKLANAKGLPAINMEGGTCSPYVEMSVGEKTMKSKTQRNTKKPVWDEIFTFFVNDPTNDQLNVKVQDEDGEEPLGVLHFNISNLLEVPDMRVKDAFTLQKCFENAELLMTVELKVLVPPKVCDPK